MHFDYDIQQVQIKKRSVFIGKTNQKPYLLKSNLNIIDV